jgi:hypothetical protein
MLEPNSQHTLRVSEPPAERIGRLLEAPREEMPLAEPSEWTPRAPRPADPGVTARLLRGRENGARQGKHQSGTAPYGYVRDYTARGRRRGVPLKIEPLEAEVIRTIFRSYAKLRSMKRVVEELNAAGMSTRRGKQWSRAGIAWILKNETYIGRVHFGSIRARGEHEAIVAPAAFQRIQVLIRKNDKRGRKARRERERGIEQPPE